MSVHFVVFTILPPLALCDHILLSPSSLASYQPHTYDGRSTGSQRPCQWGWMQPYFFVLENGFEDVLQPWVLCRFVSSSPHRRSDRSRLLSKTRYRAYGCTRWVAYLSECCSLSTGITRVAQHQGLASEMVVDPAS